MKSTTVIYQYPLALPDVYRWAADNKFILEPVLENNHHPVYQVNREEETIVLKTVDDIEEPFETRPDKLVLWGAFTKEQLSKIVKIM